MKKMSIIKYIGMLALLLSGCYVQTGGGEGYREHGRYYENHERHEYEEHRDDRDNHDRDYQDPDHQQQHEEQQQQDQDQGY